MFPHWLQLWWTYVYSPTEVLCLSTWMPGINSTGWNFFHTDLLWPIKSASTQGDFDLSEVPLESNPQTFSSMALILEKCQTCCLLSEQIPYCSSRALQVPWPALTPHSSNHYCNSDKEGFRPATWEWPKQMRGRQGILGICQPKPPHAAFREPASGILGSGYLLADPQPETNFTWLESSHKGEFSGGKSLESSAE